MDSEKTKNLIAVVLVAVIGVAFLGVVFAPLFGAVADPEAKTFVFGLFGGLIGAGGTFLYQNQRVATVKAEAAALVAGMSMPK